MFPAVTRKGKVVKVFEPVSSGDSGSFSLAHTRLSFSASGSKTDGATPRYHRPKEYRVRESMETEGMKTEKESV